MKNMTDEEKVKHCEKTLSTLKEQRNSVEPMVDEIIQFVNHGRRKITDKEQQKGLKTGYNVYDGTAISAAVLAADGIHGYLSSSSIHWFDFTLPGKWNFPRTSGMRQWNDTRMDENPEVKIWLDNCEEVQYEAFRRSNFYDFSPRYIREGISIGTANAVIEEDVARGRIMFTLPHFRECYIDQDQFGRADTLYRVYKLEMRQLVQKFGEDFLDLRDNFKQQYEKDPYQLKEVLHAVFPRMDYDPTKLDKKNKPIASIWILMEDGDKKKRLIEESGYYEAPNISWRWYVNSDEVYGRSPAWDAYIDIAKANQQGLDNLIAGHKMVDPPMVLPGDLRGRFQNYPGGQTLIDGAVTKDRVPMPIQTGIQLPYGVEQQEFTQKTIRDRFFVDFFMMLYQASVNRVELTATQVIGMQSEQAAIIGTRIGAYQSEGLDPIMDRVFAIEARAGRMPEPPQILQDLGGDANIELDYLGPLAQAQKRLFNIQGVRAGMEFATQVAQVFPSSMDIIDGDKATEIGLEAVGFPVKALRTPDQIEAIRIQRQQMEAEQRAIEQAEQASKATKNLSKEVEGNSPLEAIDQGMEDGG